MTPTFELSASKGSLRAAQLTDARATTATLLELGLQLPAPTVAVVGGAASLSDWDLARLGRLWREGLIPAIQELSASVVDGGTDSGVMRAIGEARATTNAHFPLVGVAPARRVVLSGQPAGPDEARPDLHHTHLLLVPGERWGDEAPWLSDVVTALAGPRPSVTVAVGGGRITTEDLENSVAAGRPVLLVAGLGGATDQVVAALTRGSGDHRVRQLARAGRFGVVGIDDGPEALRRELLALVASAAAVGRGWIPDRPDAAAQIAIDALELPPAKADYLRGRWLEQVAWMERKANQNRRRHYALRLCVLVASALVPALLGGADAFVGQESRGPIQGAAAVLSLFVTIAVAAEGLFRFGDRWRHYRRTVETLKREGWLYLELSGAYAVYPSHARAHASFVLKVEQILQEDVDEFMSRVAVEEPASAKQGAAPATRDPPPPAR